MKIRDETDDDIETFLDAHPHYMNKSELVRDALRHMLGSGPEANPNSRSHADAESDPLFTAPAVQVDEPVDHQDIDDVVYGSPDG